MIPTFSRYARIAREKTLQENSRAAFQVHKPAIIPGGGEL
jgi:hypothetical protein